MRKSFVVATIGLAVFMYFQQSPGAGKKVVERAITPRPASTSIVVAPNPAYSARWKTGPNAQTDLKVGPNAQTSFEPFAPSEQASWNQNPGYTITAGARIRR